MSIYVRTVGVNSQLLDNTIYTEKFKKENLDTSYMQQIYLMSCHVLSIINQFIYQLVEYMLTTPLVTCCQHIVTSVYILIQYCKQKFKYVYKY